MTVTPPPTRSKPPVHGRVSSLNKTSRNVQPPIFTWYVYGVINIPSR